MIWSELRVSLFIVFLASHASLGCVHSSDPGVRWKNFDDNAVTALKHRRYEEAEGSLQNALKEAQAFPSDDQRIAKTLGNLGWLNSERGKYPEAEQNFRQSLAIFERSLDRVIRTSRRLLIVSDWFFYTKAGTLRPSLFLIGL